jgi:tRNA1Val (adenine37-N6)-methyltransferase
MSGLYKNERIDALQTGGLKMIQAEDGYRFSLDPFLLANFSLIHKHDRVVDLGTASGILPLLIAGTTEAATVVGIELQESLYERAVRNVALNGLSGKIDIRLMDVRDVVKSSDFNVESFDVVVMNPPYRTPSTGRLSVGDERAACRHELNGGIADFLKAAKWLLRHSGSVNIVFLVERLPELLGGMSECGLEPKRLRMVHSDRTRSAHLVLVEGRKGSRPGLEVLSPLYIYEDGEYTAEIRRIFAADIGG